MMRLGRVRPLVVRTYASLESRLRPPRGHAACNICGCKLRSAEELWSQRGAISCNICRSTLRFRSLVAALQLRLHGNIDIPLAGIPANNHIVGLGMSDTSTYTYWLSKKYSYTNTFFDTEPTLDIQHPGQQYLTANDFVLSSDVFEHVTGSLDTAFANLHALLKPGGVLVFSVPYALRGKTVEHYPDLYDFRIVGEKDNRQLINRTQDGREQVFTDLRFHGGAGATLELRIFSLPDLQTHLEKAGFQDIRVHSEDYPEWGIVHANKSSVPITARA